MDPTRIGIFELAQRRMSWAAQRQAVLARNIANANTPRFQPNDVRDFAATLAATSGVTPAMTQPGHMAGTVPDSAALAPTRPRTQSPDGNAVALDEQLTKVADTETIQSLTTTIFKKYMGLFGIALGRGGAA
jgi:flagellar basal-body rod protein FlgB